jgi:site-specific DNA-methyltransferase (cytosine-N4-specific)
LNELAALEDLASGLESLPLDESQPSLFQPGDRSADYDIPQDASIDFWFDPHVSRELGTIRSRCKDLPEDARIVAQACFSSIIVAVSKQDSDTRYVRRQKDIRVGETMRRFVRAIRNAAASLAKFSTLVSPSLNCRVIHGDVLAGPDIGAVDLVVTSPPYPNAYSYHLYHMTRMLWLDMDQVGFKAREIGSHRKYSRSGPSRATAATFKNELAAVFAWLYRHVKPRGHCCFVVGDSIIHGETVQNDELVIETATTHGFELIDSLGRRLQDTKKSFNPKIGKIKEENIIILRRD